MQIKNNDIIHSRLMMFALYKTCLILHNVSIGSSHLGGGLLVFWLGFSNGHM